MDEDEAAIQAEDFQGNIPKEAGFADPRVDITVMASSTFSHLQPSAADPEAGHGSETGADVAAAAPALLGVQADNRRPEMGVRSITGEAMSSSTDGLVLYDLTSKPGSHQAFSPHCIKTILDLRLLDIGYDRQRLTFHQIRTDLASRIADNVTVPTLELSNGSHLTDSWNIAMYLAEKHPQGEARLFPKGASSKALAALLNSWGTTVFGPRLGNLIRPRICDLLDTESALYFAEVKVGRAKLDKMRALRPEERQVHIDACKVGLELVESALTQSKRHRQSSSSTSSDTSGTGASVNPTSASGHAHWIEGGELPTHADFVVYGFYCFSRTAEPAVVKEIWHSLPNVSQWVQDLTSWAGKEITADFL